MFSSGFFLLPGLATAEAGPATILSYLLAGIFILPTLFSMAELSTAMPKAGGSYYFMDRSLGPLIGTVGGLGTWMALVFKSAFALIGMGAYLVLYLDFPIETITVGLAILFTLLNVFGVKETTVLQNVLVSILIVILSVFVVAGFAEVGSLGLSETSEAQLKPFFPFGISSTIFTTGLVFVSYAGLTKVASVAEEVKDPERNIPLGMLLSLGAATFIYVTGVFILIAVLPANELREDLTPVATAAREVMDWIPGEMGTIVIVIAAVAAFASTANSGILSASRYPLAMARDELIKKKFKKISKFGTPALAVIPTGALMVLIILSFSEMGMAKLASSFQLLIFAILNLAVIIMRESRLPSYLPGYKSPLYPWMQIIGLVFSVGLITQMGTMSILFSAGIIVVGIIWFYVYARKKVVREGAIYHIFERLGRERHKELEDEFRVILKEKGPVDPEDYRNMVNGAAVFIDRNCGNYDNALNKAAKQIEQVLPVDHDEILKHLSGEENMENTPVYNKIALPHFSDPKIEETRMLIIKFQDDVVFERPGTAHDKMPLEGLIILAGIEHKKSVHLRYLSELANIIDKDDFLEKWEKANDEESIKQCFLANMDEIIDSPAPED